MTVAAFCVCCVLVWCCVLRLLRSCLVLRSDFLRVLRSYHLPHSDLAHDRCLYGHSERRTAGIGLPQLRGRGRHDHGSAGTAAGLSSVAVMAHGLVRLESVAEGVRRKRRTLGERLDFFAVPGISRWLHSHRSQHSLDSPQLLIRPLSSQISSFSLLFPLMIPIEA